MCLAPATYQDLPKGEDWCHLALSNHQASFSLWGILYKRPDWHLNFILLRISIEGWTPRGGGGGGGGGGLLHWITLFYTTLLAFFVYGVI